MRFSPRPATEDDLVQVVAIEAQSIQPPWSRESFAAELDKKTSRFWVLTDDATDEKVLAYAVISFPSEQAHLVTIAVLPEFRKHGLATYLLRRLIHYVLRRGGTSIVLEVRKSNVAAVSLYQALGFVVIRTIPRNYPDGEDAFSMIFQADQLKLQAEAEFEDSDPGSDGGKPTLN